MASGHDITYEKALEVLGLDKEASKDDIKRAYKNLARLYHPDKCKEFESTRKFQELSDAYRLLMSFDEDNENEEGFYNFEDYEDNYNMFFDLLQFFVFRRRFANRTFSPLQESSYSRKYSEKSFNSNDQDIEFYNKLKKKQKNVSEDDLDPEKVVKKYKTMEEWQKAKYSKKKSKYPRNLTKKQLNHQQYIREKQYKEIKQEILKNQEKIQSKLNKLNHQNEAWKSETLDPLTLTSLLNPKKTQIQVKTPIKQQSTITIRKPIVKKPKNDFSLPKPILTPVKPSDRSPLFLDTQTPKSKTHKIQPKLASPIPEPDWDYSSAVLVPKTVDEEEEMIKRAIAISIEDEKRDQQKIMDSIKKEKIFIRSDNVENWEKFGVRPKRNIKFPEFNSNYETETSTKNLPTNADLLLQAPIKFNSSFPRQFTIDSLPFDRLDVNEGKDENEILPPLTCDVSASSFGLAEDCDSPDLVPGRTTPEPLFIYGSGVSCSRLKSGHDEVMERKIEEMEEKFTGFDESIEKPRFMANRRGCLRFHSYSH